MKAIGMWVLGAILLFWTAEVPAHEVPPPAVREVLTQYEEESAALQKKLEAEVDKIRDQTTLALKALGDDYRKEARLDEALAVRDALRLLEETAERIPVRDLPRAAHKVCRDYEDALTTLRRKHEDEIDKIQEKTLAELKKIQDAFCKEAKLDDALAVRDLSRSIRAGFAIALPDPGFINNPARDIGKTFYYETTGVTTGAIYGDGVYTTGSSLAAAAVHSGILKVGQRGVVKVTILPGQDSYLSATRHDITSTNYGVWSVSFKVGPAFGYVAHPAAIPNKTGG